MHLLISRAALLNALTMASSCAVAGCAGEEHGPLVAAPARSDSGSVQVVTYEHPSRMPQLKLTVQDVAILPSKEQGVKAARCLTEDELLIVTNAGSLLRRTNAQGIDTVIARSPHVRISSLGVTPSSRIIAFDQGRGIALLYSGE